MLIAAKKRAVIHSSTVSMGNFCSQEWVEKYDTTTAVSQTICRSTYGPRHLTSIPTTTRTTISNVIIIQKPLQYSTSCVFVTDSATYTYTEYDNVVITETAPPLIDATTSTRNAYVSSTTYEAVTKTVLQTVTATPEPYTVSAPADFTPIASNPINAGANTFTAVQSSMSTQEDGQLTTISTDTTGDTISVPSSTGTQDGGQLATSSTGTTRQSSTTTQAEDQLTTSGTDPGPTSDSAADTPPGMRFLANDGLHVRAEKSFSNVNRVICDETTTLITTSVRPFTVRHTTLTTTSTVPCFFCLDQVAVITSFETTTVTAVPYADVVETVAITETETSSIYETTTVTPTYEGTDLPRSTEYAVCGADNIIGGIANYDIANVNARPTDRSGLSTPPDYTASSPQSCCEACASQTEETCTGSVWYRNTCFFVIYTGQCNGSEEFISFDLSRNRSAFDEMGMVLSNSACGQHVWSGRYCNENGRNCVMATDV